MEHLLEGAGIVSSFDDLESNTVADFKHGGTYFRRQGLIFFRRFIPFLQFLSSLTELILQLDIFLKGPQRIRIILFILTLHLLTLIPIKNTRLMGFSNILIFFCSLSYSLPFMPSTSIALFMLFLCLGKRLTVSRASGRHQETSCRASEASARWSPEILPDLVPETSSTLHSFPAARS